MTGVRLPEHLEILLTDEPVLDVFSVGPWRLPDRRSDGVAARAQAFARDARGEPLDKELTEYYRPNTPLLAAELNCVVQGLTGPVGSLRGGNRADLPAELLAPFLANGKPDRSPLPIRNKTS